MKKIARPYVYLVVLIGLSACGGPVNLSNLPPGVESLPQAGTVAVFLTQTALPGEQPSSTVTRVAPMQAPAKPTAIVTVVSAASPEAQEENPPTGSTPAAQTLELPCNLAQPGRPIDITIPDGTVMEPGQAFSKTWRLVNAGSCAWTADYAVMWFSGDDLGMIRTQPVGSLVQPGGSLEITVDMKAPQQAGGYQSNWKLISPDGSMFGIGPNGDAPFWARIVVEAVDTPTPSVTPEPAPPTETPTVFPSGTLILTIDQSADLDSGQVQQAVKDDLALRISAENTLALEPLNEARLAVFGVEMPTLADCLGVSWADSRVGLDLAPVGTFLCYQTSEGRPGRLLVSGVDALSSQVSVDFLTWPAP